MDGRRVSKKIFIQAAEEGDLAIVQQYIEENRGNPKALNVADENGTTALIYAANRGRIKVIDLLLATPGIDFNAANNCGNTALLCATLSGHLEAIKRLLAKQGIDINATNEYGSGPALIYALGNAKLTDIAAQMLGMPGINANVATTDGVTPLHLAVRNYLPAIVKLLLAIPGLALNASDRDGNTALIHAAKGGFEDFVILLLKAGADTSAINKKGKTAEMLAKTDAIRDLIKKNPKSMLSASPPIEIKMHESELSLFGSSSKSQATTCQGQDTSPMRAITQ